MVPAVSLDVVWRGLLPLVLGTGCFAKPDPPGAARDASVIDATDGWLTNYLYRRRITIHRGPTPSDTLVDFPVSVVLDADDDLMKRANENDRVFTAYDGITVLAFEVVSFKPTTGGIEAWVRVPSLPIGDTDIYLYYGGPATSQQSALTWSRSTGAWHMGGVQSETDSSGHVEPLVPTDGSTTPALASGIVGSARVYDGINDYLCAAAGVSPLPFDLSPASFSLWVNIKVNNGLFDSPLNRGGNSATVPGFNIELGTGTWDAEFSDGSTHISLALQPVRQNAWTYIAAVLDRSGDKATSYVDGSAVASASAMNFGSLDPATEFCLGSANYPIEGHLDEVRIYKAALPAAWFATEHANLTNRVAFMTIGDQESL